MKQQILSVVVIGTLLCIFKAFSDTTDAISYLFEVRHALSTRVVPCKKVLGTKSFDCTPPEFKSFSRYLTLEKTSWETAKDTIFRGFFALCASAMRPNAEEILVIKDTVLVKGLIHVLSCGDPRYERQSYELLHKYVQAGLLSKYGTQIIVQAKKAKLGKRETITLIALSNPPDSLRKEILRDSTLRNSLRCRLGDSVAQVKLILAAEKNSTYDDASKAIQDLFECGSVACLREAIKCFNRPVYEKGKHGCITGSLREEILLGFRKYYPDEPLFVEGLEKLRHKAYRGTFNTPYYVYDDSVKLYLLNFVSWGKRIYGVSPSDSLGEPILFKGPCDSPNQNY